MRPTRAPPRRHAHKRLQGKHGGQRDAVRSGLYGTGTPVSPLCCYGASVGSHHGQRGQQCPAVTAGGRERLSEVAQPGGVKPLGETLCAGWVGNGVGWHCGHGGRWVDALLPPTALPKQPHLLSPCRRASLHAMPSNAF